jgi:hypothetical protein
VSDIRESFAGLEYEQHPHLVSMVEFMTAGSGEDRFNFGLRLLIEGLPQAAPPEIGDLGAPGGP